jgi:S-methylmethionine transporter/histidine permease
MYASKYIHPSVGFTVAWLYWLTWTVALGSQFITMGITLQKWFPQIPIWIWCAIFSGIILLLNVLDVKIFSVSEFWLSLIKVVALGIFVILGITAITGVLPVHATRAPLFHNLTANGIFPHGFGAVFIVLLSANFAFSGTELIGVAAGETSEPEKNIPKAIKRTLFLLVTLFIGTIVVIGALIPANSKALTESPFVLILQNLGIPFASDIMNFIIFIAILSGANSGLYAASRMLWSLAEDGTLPKTFSRLSKNGLPVNGLILTLAGGLLSLFSSIYAEDTVYLALVSISGFAVVAVWLSIGISQLQFRKAFIKQHQLSELKYQTPGYPLVPWLVIILCAISLIGIYFDPNQRIALYFGIPFTILTTLVYQLFYRKQKRSNYEISTVD